MQTEKRGRGKPRHPKNAEVVATAMTGLHPARIAEQLDIEVKTVWHILWRTRKRGVEIPRQKSGPKGPWSHKYRQAAA